MTTCKKGHILILFYYLILKTHHQIPAQVERRVRVERHGTNDDGMDQVGAVGDAGEGIQAGRRQQRVNIAAIARGAGDGDPGQRQGPGRVAQRAVGGGRELR